MSLEPSHERPDESGLTPFERSLRALEPAVALLDRDRLMFEAGRAAARPARPGFAWPAMAAALAAIAAGEAALLWRNTQDAQPAQLVQTPAATPAPPPPATIAPSASPVSLAVLARSETAYERLRFQAFREALNGPIPPPPSADDAAIDRPKPAEKALSASALLRDEVDALLNPGDPAQ
ncbi:MAG: hypothetical protein U0794_15575 [Isosphaeraceae bacterium]